MSEIFSYRTIEGQAEGLFKEKGSKFLAFAYPVATEADVRDKHAQLKKEFFDARHHCFAFILGAGGKKFRTFDDGEPNHSAGDPILGQIRSRDLTDVLVVVVRYFGGTKLGIGGLISAYRAAAADALGKAKIVEKEITRVITVSYDYASTPEVMRLIRDFNLSIESQSFEDSCTFRLRYKLRDETMLDERLHLLTAWGHITTSKKVDSIADEPEK